MSYVVEAMHVTKQFKSSSANEPVIALSDVTFKAESGKITALIGPDSAGKTTFLRMVCGLLFPSKGHIKVLGKDVVTQAQEIQDCVGSSKSNKSGVRTKVHANPNFCFIPPDNLPANRLVNGNNPVI